MRFTDHVGGAPTLDSFFSESVDETSPLRALEQNLYICAGSIIGAMAEYEFDPAVSDLIVDESVTGFQVTVHSTYNNLSHRAPPSVYVVSALAELLRRSSEK